jgi:hypothetical protein
LVPWVLDDEVLRYTSAIWEGRPMAKSTKKKRKDDLEQLAITVPATMRRKIMTLAKERGTSQSEVVRDTLRFLGVKPGELVRDPSFQSGALNAGPLNTIPFNATRSEPVPLKGLEGSTVPGRITINLSGEMATRVNDLSAARGISKNSLVQSALEDSFVYRLTRARAIFIENRDDILRYSRVLIDALHEAVDYDAARQHNQPPPSLRLDDSAYRQELRNLIAELKRLNELLEKANPPAKKTSKAVETLSKHFGEFLESYAQTLGKGAAGLTIAAMAALLVKAGAANEIIDQIWARIPK